MKQLFCANCGKPNESYLLDECECENPDFRFESIEQYQAYVKNPNVVFLTTGQMVDTLKMGEIAEGVKGFYGGSRLKRTDHDEIVYMEPSSGFFSMTTFAAHGKWIIYKNESLPENLCVNCQYVSFAEDECPATNEDIDFHEDVVGITACNCFKSIGTTETA